VTVAEHLWRGLGLVSTGLALVGAVLPLVPTTPFLLVAAWAAARSSPELHAWILDHPRFGPLLRDWQEHRALRPRTKIVALLLLAASWLIMMATVEPPLARIIASAIMLIVAVFLATRPSGPRNTESD
jgi:uncharacterized membrane protein YbaN (DUF454 family)